MKAWQKILASLLFSVTLLLTSTNAAAQIVRDKLPLLTYAETTVPVYDEPDGNKKGRIPPATSLVMIKIIREDGWAYGSYKVGNKKKRVNRWFRMSDLQGYLDFENYIDRAVSDTDAYRTRTSSSLVGRVASDEEIVIVAKRGEKLKIIFLSDGGKYRMGWVDKTIFERNEQDFSAGDTETMDGEFSDGDTMTGDDLSGGVDIPTSNSDSSSAEIPNSDSNPNAAENAASDENSTLDETFESDESSNADENFNANADENPNADKNVNGNSNGESATVKAKKESAKSFESEKSDDEDISSDEEW